MNGLKLLLATQNADAFRRHMAGIPQVFSKPRPQKLIEIGFDTSDFKLNRQGLSLFLNTNGRSQSQRLTSGETVLGLQHLQEWKTSLRDASLDVDALLAVAHDDHGRFKLLRDPVLRERVVPLFAMHYRSTRWRLQLSAGQQIDVELKIGEIHCGAIVESFEHIEIVLYSGDSDAIFDFALQLQGALSLYIARFSYIDRAYALAGLKLGGPVGAGRISFREGAHVDHALRLIVTECLVQIHGNVRGLESSNNEYVHQMRVGMRRLRSALAIFSDEFPCPEEIHAGLAAMTAWLGKVRDWDVLRTVTLPGLADSWAPVTGLPEMIECALHESHQLRKNAAEIFESSASAYTWLLLHRWLARSARHDGLEVLPDHEPLRLAPFAEKVMRQFHRKLRARSKDLGTAGQLQRHRLRIAVKRLRYAIGFFLSAFPREKGLRYVRFLSELQDLLGATNDAAVAGRLLSEIGGNRPELAQDCAFAKGYLQAMAETRAKELEKMTDKFTKLEALRSK